MRNAAYAPSRDNALLLRDVVDGNYYAYRVFLGGWGRRGRGPTGGWGATRAKAALNNLGIFYASSLPSSGTDGQICLVPV